MRGLWGSAPLLVALSIIALPLTFWGFLLLYVGGQANGISTTALSYSLATTVAYAFAVTVVSFALGLSMATLWLLEKDIVRTLVSVFMIAVLTTGLLARNYGWIGFLSLPSVTRSMPILFTPYATVLVMAISLSPIVYFVCTLSMETITKAMIEGARSLGVPEMTIFTQVVLRGIFRYLLLGGALCFSAATSYFITPRMLGGNRAYFVGNLVVEELDRLGNFEAASRAALYLLAPIGLVTTLIWIAASRLPGRS